MSLFNKFIIFLAGAFLFAMVRFAPPAYAIVLQDGFHGYTGTTDTFIQSYWCDKHDDEGRNCYLEVKNKACDLEYALIRFDLSPIPCGQDILSQKLSLYKVAGDNDAINVTVYKLLSGPWKEGDGCDYTKNHADWVHRIHNASTWANGTNFSSLDYDSSSGVTVTVTCDGWYNWVLTDSYKSWYTDPSTNYGFVVIASGGTHDTTKTRYFASSDKHSCYCTCNLHPKLTVECVPEPASIVLFATGITGLFIRRKFLF